MSVESEGRGVDGFSTRRRVTLDDVARRAQVSRALVSIVMRDVKGASAATRERVFEAARELGYRPDLRARALAGQKSRLVGVVFGVAGSFHFDLLEGLYAAAEKRGYDVLLSALTRRRDEQHAVQSLHDFQFDGLVMLGPAVAEPVMAGKLPLAVVGWHVEHPDVDVVRTSDVEGMDLAVAHLVDLGHTRIAHIDGGEHLISDSRRAGYVNAMTAAGLSEQVRVVPGGETQLDGLRAAHALLAAAELPTAVIAYNDDVAVAAMNALLQAGVRVPDDVSVVGWDDSEMAQLSHVDLTSVAQDPIRMATLALERVVARSIGTAVGDREVVLSPLLQVRSSSGRAASTT
jgi:DNA-binding LacI/PurR family transcriptional regulator